MVGDVLALGWMRIYKHSSIELRRQCTGAGRDSANTEALFDSSAMHATRNIDFKEKKYGSTYINLT